LARLLGPVVVARRNGGRGRNVTGEDEGRRNFREGAR
jgi:hypothetical protein